MDKSKKFIYNIFEVGNMKILIAEPDLQIAELERDYFMIENMECDIITDGEDVISAAIEDDYGAIILEVSLPKRDGFSVCREIRKIKETPIIFVSNRSDDIDIVRGLGLGADDYITKPFSTMEFIARVKSHISRYKRLTERSQEKKPDIIRINDLTIDKNGHRVFIGNKEISMPVREFELLLFLAENPNIVFSKERLFDRLWGIDAMGDINTVTVHIQRIREKIESENTKFIETVWGAGYRFRAL